MKKFLFAAVVAPLAAGVVAFAASFGTNTSGLGAGSDVVAACGTGLIFTYTTAFDPGVSAYAVSGIDLSDIPPGCLSETVSVTFFGIDHSAAGPAVSASLPAVGTSERIAIPLGTGSIDADTVSGVSVVVF